MNECHIHTELFYFSYIFTFTTGEAREKMCRVSSSVLFRKAVANKLNIP